MCLEFNARNLTKDIDAVFSETKAVYMESYDLASKHGVTKDWLNDEVRSIKSKFKREDLRSVTDYSNIDMRIPSAEQMLAMKVLSFREPPRTDFSDVDFLLKYLGVRGYNHAMSITHSFFKASIIPSDSKIRLKKACWRLGLNGWF